MTKINYQELREAAEKATPGNWWIDSHGQAMVSFVDNEVLEVFATDNNRNAVRHEDTGNLSGWRNDNDATFIATADPATVLVLLDELESAEKRIAELESLTAPQLPQKALVVPDEMTPKQASRSYCGEVRGYRDGWNDCRAAMLKLSCNSEQLDEVGSWNNHRNTPTAQDGNHTEQNLDMVDHFGDATKKAMLHGSEPETDNTNLQFESLSRVDK